MKHLYRALLLALLFSVACRSQTAINNVTLTVSSLSVTPANPVTVVGGTVNLHCLAIVTPGNITKDLTDQVSWQSSVPAVASMGSTNTAGLNVATGQSLGTTSITCQDGAGDVSDPTTLTIVASPNINNPNSATCANPCPLTPGTQNSIYPSFFFAAEGGSPPYTWSNSAGTPPTGLSLSAGGALTGTPTGTGTTSWTVRVCDSVPTCTTQVVSVTVNAAPACGTWPNLCAYTGVDLVSWNSGNVPSVVSGGNPLQKNGAVVYDTTLPSSNQSPISHCTDFYTEPGLPTAVTNKQSKSAGLGGSGDAKQLFSSNSSMLHYNTSGGGGRIILFNPSTMVCGDPITGLAITADKNLTNPGSSSTSYAFGGGSFDWTDASAAAGNSIWYAYGSGNDAPTDSVVAKLTISQTNGTFTVVTPFLDFNYGLPVGALAPAWQPNHQYAFGAYISATLTLGDWNGVTAYIAGDLIIPLANNPLNCAFKLSTVGTRGAQPNPWSRTLDGSCVTAQIKAETGGTETWRNIGNSGTFTFQLTSNGGTSGGATPNWKTASGHPDQQSTVTDGPLTWTNSGVTITPNWHSFAGISKDSGRGCNAFSSNGYGHGTGTYNADNADQGTGIFASCYSFTLNKFFLLNTVTGIQSTTTCLPPGTGYTCAGGTLPQLVAAGPALTTITTCPFPIHNMKGGSTLDYVGIVQQGNYGAAGCNAQNMVAWTPFAAYNQTTSAQRYATKSNHQAIGKNLMVNVGDQFTAGWGTAGAYTTQIQSSTPQATPLTGWQVGAPYTNPCHVHGVWTPNDLSPPCFFSDAYDSHLTFWSDPADDDTGPMCGTIYNYATLAPPPVAPYQGEEVCVSTSPSWSVGSAIGAYKVWRFAHIFNTGGSAFFDTQFGISQLSTDGKFLAFSSDWNCSLGTTDGTAGPSNCGPPWVAGTTYATNALINPFSSTGGSGTNYGVYQVQAPGGKAAATKPAWFVCNSGSVNSTVTDAAGIVYKCKAPANGKGEVFVVKVQ